MRHCRGNRYGFGERLYLDKKVLDAELTHDQWAGVRLKAKVSSSMNALKCKAPSKPYDTWIKMKSYTIKQMWEAQTIISKQPCWKALVAHPLSSDGTPLLRTLKFSHVPFQLAQVLNFHEPENDSGKLEAGCSCPDSTRGWCKHVAALSFVLIEFGERVPEDLMLCLGCDLECEGRTQLLHPKNEETTLVGGGNEFETGRRMDTWIHVDTLTLQVSSDTDTSDTAVYRIQPSADTCTYSVS